MNKINTIVIDIEDLDLAPTAVILSIGAFAFDVNNIEVTSKNIVELSKLASNDECRGFYGFYTVVGVFNQLVMGRTIGNDTLEWWKKQNDAKKAISSSYIQPLPSALLALANWLRQFSAGTSIYFRGPDHDASILENAYQMIEGLVRPWSYNQKRDVRTYIDALMGTDNGYLKEYTPCFKMIKHHALHDAMSDAEQMCIATIKNCFK